MTADVYIDGQRLNIKDANGLPFSFSFSIAESENPGKVSGSRSKRYVNFPSDSTNDAFFQHWHDAASENKASARRRNARVEVNGIPVFQGVAQLQNVVLNAGAHRRQAQGYRVAFFGNNATWFSLIADLQIRQLGVMPAHDLTRAVVSDNDNPTPGVERWGYLLARTKDWAEEDNVKWSEMTPFVYIKEVVLEAFATAGYSIDSSFFATDFFSRLALPCPLRPYPEEVTDSFRYFGFDLDNSTPMVNGVFTHVTVNGSFININTGGHYNQTTGYYTAPISGFYIIGVLQDLITQFAIRARLNGSTVLAKFTIPCEVGVGFQGRVYLEEGDTIDLVVNSSQLDAGSQMLYIRTDINEFEEGTGIKFDKYGNPDWTVGDLVLGITQAFGLIWDTDYQLQKVRVEPRDRYTLRSREPNTETATEGFYYTAARRDITGLLDLSKNAELENVLNANRRVELAWKSDSADQNVETVENGASVLLYDAAFLLDEQRYSEGTTRNENRFFAKTIHVLDAEIAATGSAFAPLLPLMQSEAYGTPNDERGDFDPRILYFAGRRDGLDGLVNMQNVVGTGSFAYDFPASWMVPYNDTSGYDPSLSFGDEVRRDGSTVRGLMYTFHFQYLARLENGKRLTEWVKWSALDVLGLDFRTKLLIDGTLYLLEQVDGYSPLRDGSTETTLIADSVLPSNAEVISSEIKGYLPKTR